MAPVLRILTLAEDTARRYRVPRQRLLQLRLQRQRRPQRLRLLPLPHRLQDQPQPQPQPQPQHLLRLQRHLLHLRQVLPFK